MEPLYSPQIRAERLIASGRVVLALSSLFAIWFDPDEPAKLAPVAYSLLVAYVVYSALIALWAWNAAAPSNRQRLFTHAFDLAFFTAFIYFTSGPASPFVVYFVFSLVCATLRWQWKGTLWTALVSLAAFFGLGSLLSAANAVDAYPLVVRGVYLAVISVLLGYLGVHEQQTRREMALLASWPPLLLPQSLEALVQGLLEHAAQVLRAPRLLLRWNEPEEDEAVSVWWQGGVFSWSRGNREPVEPSDADFRERHRIRSVLALRVRAEALQGRLWVLDKRGMTSDDLVLGEIVAGVIGSRLDHFYLHRSLQQAVATEERIRLARDLHDGVLQSLTGIGLRLAAVRRELADAAPEALGRVDDLQRLIALEQRDLRFFIQDLKPSLSAPGELPSLSARIAELVHRVELEWGLRVELCAAGLDEQTPEPLAREIYLLVREALVNAVRHGEATAVRLEIALGEQAAITVSDNGRGFPFQGRYSQQALREKSLGPRTLLERVAALHGTVTIDSAATGARLEIVLP